MPARLVLNRDAATAKATADHLLAEQLGTEGAHAQNVGHDFDPKPENETGGKLSPTSGCGPLDESGRRTNAEKRAQRRED
ncbi:MAG: hypothetical protein ABSH37_11290, partial [Bryobacteraceae bacterium]